MNRLSIYGCTALLLAPMALYAAEELPAPVAMIKKLADETLHEIRQDTRLQSDTAQLQSFVNTKLVPHFDFTRLTQLATGKHWRTAKPEQQKELTEQFQRLLVRTYSNALLSYKNREIEYLPLKSKTLDQDVVVRTRVTGAGKSPVAVDYTLMSTAQGWKAYDVSVAGVSLVTNYRDEFNSTIKDKGIDGLIALLKEKNTQPASKTSAK